MVIVHIFPLVGIFYQENLATLDGKRRQNWANLNLLGFEKNILRAKAFLSQY
jgi:hypothetical protein